MSTPRMMVTLVGISGILLVFGAAAAFGDDVSHTPGVAAAGIDQIADALATRERRAVTVRYRCTNRFTTMPGTFEGAVKEKTVYERSLSAAMSGDKIRHEHDYIVVSLNHELTRSRDVRTWDGAHLSCLIYASAGVPYPRGSRISSVLVSDPWHDLDIVPLFIAFRPFHYLFCRLDRLKQRFRVVPGEHSVEGRSCVLIQDSPRDATRSLSLYLDPQRDFALVRLRDGVGKHANRYTVHEYRLVEGVWAPVRWTMECGVMSVSQSTAEDIEVNVPVDPSEFQVEFPPGTWVAEIGEPNTYMVKEGGARRIITDAESVSGHTPADFLATETGAFGAQLQIPAVVRRRETGGARHEQFNSLKFHQRWSVLVAQDDGIDVTMVAAGDPDADMRELAKAVIDNPSCARLLFGIDRDEESARALLNKRLARLMARVNEACRPTAAQQAKLELAGRTDISRFFRRVDELRPQIKRVYDGLAARRGELDDALDRLLPKARALRRTLDSRDFDDDSLFAKTLKNLLAAEQFAAYEAAKADDGPKGDAPGQNAESAPKPDDK